MYKMLKSSEMIRLSSGDANIITGRNVSGLGAGEIRDVKELKPVEADEPCAASALDSLVIHPDMKRR